MAVCPEVATLSECIVNKSLGVLHALVPRWPIASRWLEALRKVAHPMQMESRARTSLNRIDRGAYSNLGISEIVNEDNRTSVLNSRFEMKQFLNMSKYVDFNFALDFDGQLSQFL